MTAAGCFSRAFGPVRSRQERDLLLAGMTAGGARQDWAGRPGFATGVLACSIDGTTYLSTQVTASTAWRPGTGEDAVGVALIGEGRARMRHGGQALTVAAGDAYTYAGDRDMWCHTLEYQRKSHVTVPRRRLREAGLDGSVLGASGEFVARNGIVDILFAHLHQVAQRMQHGPDLTSRALAAINAAIVEMVAAVLQEQPAKRDGETAVVSRAQAFIDDHLRDPGLTPARVAAALNVSLRTLYRSFDVDGQTIAAYIRRHRLLRTRRDLAAMKTTGNIYVVAQRWGFADKSHFAKLFLREFGCLPSEYVRNL